MNGLVKDLREARIGRRRARAQAASVQQASTSLPTYDPATHVAVPIITAEQALVLTEDSWGRRYAGKTVVRILRDMGVVRREPTTAEVISNRINVPVAVVEKVLASSRRIERGAEITDG